MGAIRRTRPALVLTHDPTMLWTRVGDRYHLGHTDHQAAGRGLLAAVYPRAALPTFFPEQIAAGLEPWWVRELWLFDTNEPDYRHDIEAQGIDFLVAPRSDVGATARSLILVTPDAQRTMNTYLGAAQLLEKGSVDPAAVADSAIIYLEGYLWDPAEPRAAMEAAIEVAHAAGRKVAFTLSDTFCVDRHRDGFWQLLRDGKVDILFANEAEAASMAMVNDLEEAIACIAEAVPTLVVTRSEAGAIAVSGRERAEVPAEPIERLVDTTGAGDLFAAGFLAGEARGLGLEASLRLGAIAAAEVIQHYGARPEKDLKALAGELVA